MDSFFSCVGLYQDLLKENTTACGTVLLYRNNPGGNPEAFKSKTLKLAKGAIAVQQKDSLIAMRFYDRKDCMFLSTIHTVKPILTGKKKRTETGEEVAVNKPEIVHMYNQSIGGIDTMDQHLSYYAFNRKTMKWWKRAATHLIHIAKVQAHILFKKSHPKVSQLEFTKTLVLQLVNEPNMGPDPSGPMGDARVQLVPDDQAHDDHAFASAHLVLTPVQLQSVAPMEFQRLKCQEYEHFPEPIPTTATT